MPWKIRLRTKMLSAFILVGLLAFVVAYIGWRSNSRLIQGITSIEDTVDGLVGIWKVKTGLMQIASAERMLLNPRLSQEQRQRVGANVSKFLTLIDEGVREYEATSRLAEEERLYKQFLRDLNVWKQHHEEFI